MHLKQFFLRNLLDIVTLIFGLVLFTYGSVIIGHMSSSDMCMGVTTTVLGLSTMGVIVIKRRIW